MDQLRAELQYDRTRMYIVDAYESPYVTQETKELLKGIVVTKENAKEALDQAVALCKYDSDAASQDFGMTMIKSGATVITVGVLIAGTCYITNQCLPEESTFLKRSMKCGCWIGVAGIVMMLAAGH